MGLDMYVYRIEKLTDEEAISIAGTPTSEIRNKYHYIDKETVDGDPDMYSDLLPYVKEIPVVETLFDYNLCFMNHGIKFDDSVCGSFHASDKVGWFFQSGAKLELDRAEYEKYLYEADTLIYVFKSEQVAYWRKYYDLDEFLQTVRFVCRSKKFIEEHGAPPKDDDILSWRTENCGYYMLSPEEKKALKAYLAENEEGCNCDDYHQDWNELLDNDDSVLMYHAWW